MQIQSKVNISNLPQDCTLYERIVEMHEQLNEAIDKNWTIKQINDIRQTNILFNLNNPLDTVQSQNVKQFNTTISSLLIEKPYLIVKLTLQQDNMNEMNNYFNKNYSLFDIASSIISEIKKSIIQIQEFIDPEKQQNIETSIIQSKLQQAYNFLQTITFGMICNNRNKFSSIQGTPFLLSTLLQNINGFIKKDLNIINKIKEDVLLNNNLKLTQLVLYALLHDSIVISHSQIDLIVEKNIDISKPWKTIMFNLRYFTLKDEEPLQNINGINNQMLTDMQIFSINNIVTRLGPDELNFYTRQQFISIKFQIYIDLNEVQQIQQIPKQQNEQNENQNYDNQFALTLIEKEFEKEMNILYTLPSNLKKKRQTFSTFCEKVNRRIKPSLTYNNSPIQQSKDILIDKATSNRSQHGQDQQQIIQIENVEKQNDEDNNQKASLQQNNSVLSNIDGNVDDSCEASLANKNIIDLLNNNIVLKNPNNIEKQDNNVSCQEEVIEITKM